MKNNLKEINVYFEKKGQGKQDVILMHGWGQNTEMMDPIAKHLEADFTVYNIDLPPFGKSDDLKSPWGVSEYYDMLKEFTEKNKINNPIIIAHSFGVRIAIMYAAKNAVHKLVITGGAGILPKRGLKYYFNTYKYKLGKKVLSLPGLNKVKEKYQKNAGSEDYRGLSPLMKKSFVKIVNLDLSDYLRQISCPTLLVWGEKDEATPLWMGKKMEEEIENAGLAIFENDGHYAYWNQMPRFLSVIDIFLKEDKR